MGTLAPGIWGLMHDYFVYNVLFMSILKESPAEDALEQEVVLNLSLEVPPSSPDTRDLPPKFTSGFFTP